MGKLKRLTYKHRNYLATFFVLDKLGKRYDPWGIRREVMTSYSSKIRDLILRCIEKEKGNGFYEFFNKNSGMFGKQYSLYSVANLVKDFEIDVKGLSKIIEDTIILPCSKKTNKWSVDDILNIILNRAPLLNIEEAGGLPFLQDFFERSNSLAFFNKFRQDYLFREIQNTIINLCIDYFRTPPELIDYFYNVSWDPLRLDCRTFLMPQKIFTLEELKKHYPIYYNQLKIKFWNEF